MDEIKFLPVLLGSDINVYSMARAFHEQYGTKSLMVARHRDELTGEGLTQLFDYIEEPSLDKEEVFMKTMSMVISKYGLEKRLLLLACADSYVRLIVENKTELAEMGFVIPYSDKKVLDNLILKENLYRACDIYALEYPTTYIYKPWMSFAVPAFSYPVVLKASDTVKYHKHKFDGFEKVFFLESEEELIEKLHLIYENGYDGNMIIQDYVPGDDDCEYDLQMYIGRDHQAKIANLGNVVLNEHVPSSIGNNVATITVYNEKLMREVTHMLEAIGYVGYADADIKYDARDGLYKVLEVNVRQGSSNYRVTGGGNNFAKYVVDDFIYQKKIKQVFVDRPFFWHIVPLPLIYLFVKDVNKKNAIRELVSQHKTCNSLRYESDMPFKRWIYLMGRNIKYFVQFLKFYHL